MVRRTVSGACWIRGSTASSAANPAASTSRTRARRLRRARDLPYLLFLLEYATAQTPLHELLGLPPKFIHAAVVLYHHIGQPGLLLRFKLPRLDGAERHLVHAPLRSPRPPSLLWHDHSHGVVVVRAASTLEQERHLGHEEVGLGGRDAPLCLAAHEGVQDLFEVVQGFGVPEDLAAEGPAVHATLAEHVAPEAIDDAGDSLLVPGEKVVDDLVCRYRLGAELAEEPDEGALA